MRLSRHGVTLVEVVVATSLAGGLAVLTALVLVRAGRAVRERSGRAAAEHALRTGSLALRAVLRGGEPAGGDLFLAAPSGFGARVVRGQSVLCGVQGGALIARRHPAWWSGVREPVAGRDSIMVGKIREPGWTVLALRGAPVSRPCPDGTAGTGLPVALDSLPLSGIGPGSPVRYFEPVELRSYSSAGAEWLGIRLIATGEAIQPLAGPLAPDGLRLQYLGADREPATFPAGVAGAGFLLRVRAPGGADSLAGTIALGGGVR